MANLEEPKESREVALLTTTNLISTGFNMNIKSQRISIFQQQTVKNIFRERPFTNSKITYKIHKTVNRK